MRKTFGFLSHAKAMSRLVFTYIRKDFIDGTILYGLDTLYQVYRMKSPLWHFGLDPDQVSAFLGEYGWKELEQVGSQEYSEWYLKSVSRNIPVTEIERAVYAEKL